MFEGAKMESDLFYSLPKVKIEVESYVGMGWLIRFIKSIEKLSLSLSWSQRSRLQVAWQTSLANNVTELSFIYWKLYMMNICIPYFAEINLGHVIYGYVYFSDLVRINWESSVSPLVKTCSSSEHIVFWVKGTVSLWSL